MYTIFPFNTGIMASDGTNMVFSCLLSTSFTLAKEPGRSSSEGLGASAFICKVRVCSSMPGSMANTFPLNVLPEASVVKEIGEFSLICAAYFSGIEKPIFIGFVFIKLAIVVEGVRYSPTEMERIPTLPLNGALKLVLDNCARTSCACAFNDFRFAAAISYSS
ncbi:hypothetical protein D9M68_641490 [compost metagenome]